MSKTTFPDYFQIEKQLTAEEIHFRDRVRRLVEEEAMPVIVEHFDKATFPLEIIAKMAELDLFGVHVDGYGCRKAGHTAYGLACQELGRCDSGLRAMFSVQNSLVMYPIYAFGSEKQRQIWLPKLHGGQAIGCFGLSEPGFGSNPAGMTTHAAPQGKNYVLNGTKMWITHGPIAQVALIWAKTKEGIRCFLIETNTPGFRATAIQHKFAYRTSPTALLELKNCEVGPETVLPGALGLKAAFECLNHARYGVACSAVGSAMACYQAARNFAGDREVFDRPIASYQLVQERLADMLLEITKAQLMNYHLGRLMDEGRARHPQISMAKMNSVREAVRVARLARDVLGGRGILADQHVIRHLCDLEALSALEGTESLHTLVIGQDITGIAAFKC
ncbi:MAG: acyl-CoA dehydrogenase family protein [Deltaproteobacteria bacterium]